jgi:hypothetical protein
LVLKPSEIFLRLTHFLLIALIVTQTGFHQTPNIGRIVPVKIIQRKRKPQKNDQENEQKFHRVLLAKQKLAILLK